MDKTTKMIAAAVSAATMRAFSDAGMQQEYRDGMRYMRAEIVTALSNAMYESNPRFDGEAFRDACLTPNHLARTA